MTMITKTNVALPGYSGADPGFPLGAGADPRLGGGGPTYDSVKISKKKNARNFGP